MPGEDSNRGAKRAREARAALGLDPAAPLECVLSAVEQRAGVPVVIRTMPPEVAGACFRDGGAAVLWLNGEQAAVRRRFTLAHEYGHAYCRHDGRLEPDTIATLNGRTTNPVEIQANAFAAEFLVPRDGLREAIGDEPTLVDVVELAARYGVSAIVIVYRLKLLRLGSPERIVRLRREVDEQLHLELAAALGLAGVSDRLSRVEHLPYLSPALEGTRLDAALRGEVAVDAATAGAIDRLLG